MSSEQKSASTALQRPQGPALRQEEWERIVFEEVKRLRFGVVQITIHEGRVTQIETTEKTRLTEKGVVGS